MSARLRAAISHASWSLFFSFDYTAANRFLAEAFAELAEIPTPELADPELARLLYEAHFLKAVLLRDRSDVGAEQHFVAALRALPKGDIESRRSILGGLVTARLNRRDHVGAGRVLGSMMRHMAGGELDADNLSKVARWHEAAGCYDKAASIMRNAVLPRSLDSPQWEATARTALARQTALSALTLPPQQRLQAFRNALEELERAAELLSEHRHDIWTVSNRASWGLISVMVGDRETARSLLRESTQLLRRVAIRNKWVEELSASLGPDPESDSSSSLTVAWARMYYARSFSSDRLAFLELERGLEHLLRCAASWDGTEVRPQAVTAPGMRLWRSANERLLLTEGLELRSVVSDREIIHLLQSRNSAAHEVSPSSSINYGQECLTLAAHLERLEALLPHELLDQATGDFHFWRTP